MAEPKKEKTYWLDKKENVSKIYYALCGVCIALFLSDFVYHKHVVFPMEGWFGYYALYGFASAWTLVLLAKQLRRVIGRPEDYYDR